MTWYRIPLRFAQPANRQAVDDLAELLDYPDVAEVDLEGREYVLILEADDAVAASASIAEVLREHAAAVGRAEQGEPIESPDPRLPSQRTIETLTVATDMLADQLVDDVAALREGLTVSETLVVSEFLPACFARHYSPDLVGRWIEAVQLVGTVLAHYPDSYLASTAEELAGHAIIREAKGLVASYAEDNLYTAEELASVRDKLEEIHDLAFEDHDVLMLFNARLDGLEEGPGAERMGFVNLHPRDWFEPFDPERLAARKL